MFDLILHYVGVSENVALFIVMLLYRDWIRNNYGWFCHVQRSTKENGCSWKRHSVIYTATSRMRLKVLYWF